MESNTLSSPESPELQPWGEYAPFVSRVLTRDLAGFFVQHESGFKIPETWPDGVSVSRYKNTIGTLVFRPKGWVEYGYANEAAFAKAVSKCEIPCKTTAGAISLGRIRKADRDGHLVILQGQGVANHTFHAKTEPEAQAIASYLRGVFPGRRVFVATSGLMGALVLTGLFDFARIKQMLHMIPPRWKPTLLCLGLLGIVSFAASTAAAFQYLPGWILPVTLLIFPLAIVISISIINSHLRSLSDSEQEVKS